MKHPIPIENAYKLKKFHNTLYTLHNDYSALNDPFSIKSTVKEVILLEEDISKWNNDMVDVNDLFVINRAINYDVLMENIYADETYFYVIGNASHYLYERAIPRSVLAESHRVSKKFTDPDVTAVTKFILNGQDYLVAIGPTKISEY